MTTNITETSTLTAAVTARQRLRALGGSAIGSTVEWYDFFLYGTMVGLVFGPLFFPAGDPVASQLLALATFALAFIARPIGGILFSHIGDRLGRKRTLVITLTLMGASTILIGFLPTYEQVGMLAPVLLVLLRLLQGLAMGGEWGGGALMAIEYAPQRHRGLFGAIPQTGGLLGLALGNLATMAANSAFSEEDFLTIGWRIPFIGSIVLIFIGLWIRHAVHETPSFRTVEKEGLKARVPLAETLRHHWRAVLIATGGKIIETVTFFLFATFTLSYGQTLGFDRAVLLNAVLVAALIAVAAEIGVGALSDRVGRKLLYILGCVLISIYAIPFLWMINQGSEALYVVAVIVGFGLIWPLYGALVGTVFAESFSANVRYTGISLGYQLGSVVGGTFPFIATALLIAFDGSYVPVGIGVIVAAVISIVAISFAKDKTNKPLD